MVEGGGSSKDLTTELGLMVIWKLVGHSTAREGRFRRDMAGLGKGRPGATFRSTIFSKKACAWL